MKTAFATWDNRIAPVFDIARQIHLVEVKSGRIVAETEEVMADDMPVRKALRLVEMGAATLVCGAISRSFQDMITSYGVRVIPFVAGDLREVIQAWLNNRLAGNDFAMPGCCIRRHRRSWDKRYIGEEKYPMKDYQHGGLRQGGGNGRAQGGKRRGRPKSHCSTGADGFCFCPHCGQREPHERGIACTDRKCPKCGNAMIRE